MPKTASASKYTCLINYLHNYLLMYLSAPTNIGVLYMVQFN